MAATKESQRFERLRIEGWRQFGRIDLELHDSLTVITGRNGSGKSTLLNVLSQHFGYFRHFLATPAMDQESGTYNYWSGVLNWIRQLASPEAPAPQIGEIAYSNGVKAPIYQEVLSALQYNLNFTQQPVKGFHVSSHRRQGVYQQVNNIPTWPMLPDNAYGRFDQEARQEYAEGNSSFTPTYRIKESLLSMAAFGPASKYNAGNKILLDVFDGYIGVLRKVLPPEVGFVDISIRGQDVVLVTKSGSFLIDAASGGIRALLDLSWQIHLFSLNAERFTVTIDEPENHLHPSMQQALMSSLIAAFPQVQFIVATHSPFIISAEKNSAVYVLRHVDVGDIGLSADQQQTKVVESVRLDNSNLAGSANEVLRDVLGLPTTYPVWVHRDVNALIEAYRGKEVDAALLDQLRQDLYGRGLGEFFPDAMGRVLEE